MDINITRQFSDIDLDFIPHPITGDIVKINDIESIKTSVRNLIETNHYERPFHPEIGSGIRSLLFEPITQITASSIQRAIRETLENYEPRVEVNTILVIPDDGNNRFDVVISFFALNNPAPQQITLILERLR